MKGAASLGALWSETAESLVRARRMTSLSVALIAISIGLVGAFFLVADEPTGNLDHRLAQDVMKLFVEISLRGTTVLVATHDQDLVRASGRRCLTLDGGRVLEGLVEPALPPQAVYRREEPPR